MLYYNEATSRCWAEVDLTRLAANYQTAMSHLHGDTRLICVLKADAYGLGTPMVARRLWQEGARSFAVASCNEAEELRRAVPEAEVLILGLAGEDALLRAIREGMLLTVFSRAYGQRVLRAAEKAGCKARVHVKVETGLNRIGFVPEEVVPAVQMMQESGLCEVEGIFTHLALRTPEGDVEQISSFHDALNALTAAGITVPMAHICDSIGMVRYPAEHLDAVRTGAWLYGVCPRRYEHPEECRLTMAVKARVAQLHRVPAGEMVGYDEDHPIDHDALVATLSCGYIDGYPRLNSRGFVEIRGQRAPVVGLVCMDQMMVDVTDIPGVQEGDAATLLGGSIGVDEYADVAGLNRNESLARMGKRVPRVYLENGEVISIVDGLE